MVAYYNEHNPYAAQWLRNLIAAGHIADGDVDERSIEDVRPDELAGYTQCHFFAGIGGWSYALRLAGWPDDRPVWTGSCPCQPFSAAGKGAGTADERHLWPAWQWLIRQCRPSVIFGEQVEAAINHGWLDLVQADLEGEGYAFGAVGLPAAGIGAPHIRQRLWFVAERLGYASGAGLPERIGIGGVQRETMGASTGETDFSTSDSGGLADAEHPERRTISINREDGCDGKDSGRQEAHSEPGTCGEVLGVAGGKKTFCEWFGVCRNPNDCDGNGSRHCEPDGWQWDANEGWIESSGLALPYRTGSQPRRTATEATRYGYPSESESGPDRHEQADALDGFWRASDWLYCRDGKWRPVEPGTFPLASGIPARVGRLRGYGNAIVPPLASEFIKAFLTR